MRAVARNVVDAVKAIAFVASMTIAMAFGLLAFAVILGMVAAIEPKG